MICRGLCACTEMLWMCVLCVSFGSKVINLSAAFDTVCHDKMLSKINRSQLHPATTRLLSCYLRGRQCKACFKGVKSTSGKSTLAYRKAPHCAPRYSASTLLTRRDKSEDSQLLLVKFPKKLRETYTSINKHRDYVEEWVSSRNNILRITKGNSTHDV